VTERSPRQKQLPVGRTVSVTFRLSPSVLSPSVVCHRPLLPSVVTVRCLSNTIFCTSPLDIRPERSLPSGRMSTQKKDNPLGLLQGTLDLLILQTLLFGRAHGHAIARSIELRSEEVLRVGHGSLYPALQRLLKLKLIATDDGISENNRKARFYRLTEKGRKALSAETSKWQRLSEAIARILTPAAPETH